MGNYKYTLGFQYFIYFGVMGVYLPFFNLYCYHLNFDGFQIGALSATRTLVMVIFSLIWGAVADQFSIRKPIYILCNILSAIAWSLLLFTTDFWLMTGVIIVYSIFYGPIIPFLEAITMESLGSGSAEKRSYGNIRVWGSLNFILVVVLLGRVMDIVPVSIILVLVLIGSLIQAASSFWIPGVPPSPRGSFLTSIGTLFNLKTFIFLACSFLMLASHGTYYGFFSIHLETIGYDNTFIGIAWGLATVSEILVMVKSDVIFRRFSIKSVLIVSFFVAALRWLILFWATSPGMILLAQCLHAITYGTFHIGCILYMDTLTTQETKTFGQVANNAVSYGLGMMTGFLLNGALFERYGSQLFIMSGIMALFGALFMAIGAPQRNCEPGD